MLQTYMASQGIGSSVALSALPVVARELLHILYYALEGNHFIQYM
jgi:hypothetical protein